LSEIKEIPVDWWRTYGRPATKEDWKKWTFFSFREDLENIPEYPAPEGYRIRMYQGPADREAWAKVWQAASIKGWDWATLETFDHDFGTSPVVLSRRCLFAETARGKAVGIVSAWHKRMYGKRWGMIHWFGVAPAHQGRGLGKALLTECLRTMRSLGHRRAMVGTQLIRLPAIKTYLDMGFVPEDAAIRKLLRKYIGRHASLPI